jgi:hypothetical protein
MENEEKTLTLLLWDATKKSYIPQKRKARIFRFADFLLTFCFARNIEGFSFATFECRTGTHMDKSDSDIRLIKATYNKIKEKGEAVTKKQIGMWIAENGELNQEILNDYK